MPERLEHTFRLEVPSHCSMRGCLHHMHSGLLSIFYLCPLIPISLFSVVFLALCVYYVVHFDAESLKIAGGVAILLLLLHITSLLVGIKRVKSEIEPFYARVLTVVLSAVATFMWSAVYVLGMIYG